MKVKERAAVLSILMMISLVCSGCMEPFPELSEEEYDQIVQFSAAMVMRHSNNGVEKLATVTPRRIRQLDENPYAAAQVVWEEDTAEAASTDAATEASSEKKPSKTSKDKKKDDTASAAGKSETNAASEGKTETSDVKPALEPVEEEAPDTGGDGTTQETPQEVTEPEETVQPAEETQTDEPEGNNSVESVQAGTQQEILGGLTITYTGYTVTSAYPDDSYAYALDASPGKKLLILGFRISNMTGSDKELDMIRSNPHFQILVNGENQGYTLVTVLDNDLSSFKGVIPADSKKQLILAIQVDADTAKSIQSLGMVASMGDDVQTIMLED